MLGSLPMPAPEPAVPETNERRCPRCQSDALEPPGRVIAASDAGGVVKVEHRCQSCGLVFLFALKPSA
jgi:predicted Zn-ribbon and HTH transcriptional regulator